MSIKWIASWLFVLQYLSPGHMHYRSPFYVKNEFRLDSVNSRMHTHQNDQLPEETENDSLSSRKSEPSNV